MAKAFKCDLCGKLTEYAEKVGGLNFKIGEYRDEFTGRHARMKEIEDICPDCHEKIIATVRDIYEQSKKE